MFSLFSLLLYVFIDMRLSHLNKDYLLTYLLYRHHTWLHLIPRTTWTSNLHYDTTIVFRLET